jgi:hypothetical protein
VACPVTIVGAGGVGGTVAGAAAAGMVLGEEEDMQPTAISDAANTEEARVRFMFRTSNESLREMVRKDSTADAIRAGRRGILPACCYSAPVNFLISSGVWRYVLNESG